MKDASAPAGHREFASEDSAASPRVAWAVLESLPQLSAAALTWRRLAGQGFHSLRNLCLQPKPELVGAVPCPRFCGCAHEVIRHSADDIVAACRCEPWRCPDLPLTHEDIRIWEVSWSKLGRALCTGLGLDSRPADTGLFQTRQVGSWSANAVPVLVSVQNHPPGLSQVMAGLAARLGQPFILLAPTSRHLDVRSKELLAGARAEVFDLESIATVTSAGTLVTRQTPGELFARFNPQPHERQDQVARAALAMLQQLESGAPLKAPGVLTVFQMYCVEGRSAGQIARRCGTSKATVLRRLGLIRKKTGLHPDRLRIVSAHLDKIGETLADPRARRICRKTLTNDIDALDEE